MPTIEQCWLSFHSVGWLVWLAQRDRMEQMLQTLQRLLV